MPFTLYNGRATWDKAGKTSAGTATTTQTVNYLTGLGIDERYSRSDSTGTQSYLTDALGSTLALADSAGTLQTQYSYDPFGNTTVTGTTNPNAFQYTGRENDGNGLYYYRARYYSPQWQRFISSDPIGLRGGVNTYAYVHNNPVNFTDPSGLICTLNQGTGRLICTDDGGVYVDDTGYSGSSDGLNDPNFNYVRNIGPLPRGCWRVGTPNNGIGPITLPLVPLPDNSVFDSNRDPNSFFMHGDNGSGLRNASRGCPVFGRKTREKIPSGEIICVVP